MDGLGFFESLFVFLALGGAAWGLLQFGVGAMLWAEQKLLMLIGFFAAMGGLYLGILVLFLLVSPHMS